MASLYDATQKPRAKHRFVAHWLLFMLLQQAMFATGTMAGSSANGSGWVMLCIGSSDVAQLVYLGDQEHPSSHSQTEQCPFSGGVLAHAFTPDQVVHLDLSLQIDTQYSFRLSEASRYFKLPRAPPFSLV
ncbi:hypothetical protein A3758_19410 [Oleiphilus sp. HI0118]|uniref:hypothetical protein n=1 Tax=Oleiphilus sp. HI0079 TaxID=1822254 RepID=UPI0007C40308|nr:hypothetical protein [Oleiphilus sp. HI0079]KZZ40687.1 hypothetical protein A3758_08170 [Oleiphilus sp. HI0118]KZZ82279.1 hypothetical protein A3767_04470 [Oleiphilus sp. HI0133]KZZ10282.1 hypothetical protein A3750_20745 [Oleiphilus sp. HI0079]KZZ16373.1 hypothetical protein A3750_00980 [Oleiphilus sp. HI0079]KZZ43908.1 hypothetical protein A3758_19410 [Oleiphilus sp. HI0118]